MARDVVAEIQRATRRKFRAEDKIRIVLAAQVSRRVAVTFVFQAIG